MTNDWSELYPDEAGPLGIDVYGDEFPNPNQPFSRYTVSHTLPMTLVNDPFNDIEEPSPGSVIVAVTQSYDRNTEDYVYEVRMSCGFSFFSVWRPEYEAHIMSFAAAEADAHAALASLDNALADLAQPLVADALSVPALMAEVA